MKHSEVLKVTQLIEQARNCLREAEKVASENGFHVSQNLDFSEIGIKGIDEFADTLGIEIVHNGWTSSGAEELIARYNGIEYWEIIRKENGDGKCI